MANVNIDDESKNPKTKTAVSPEMWRAHYSEWEQSSLSKREFCSARGLVIDNFYYWCKRIRDEKSSATSTGFAPVVSRNIETSRSELITVEILLPNQTRLKFAIKEIQLVSLIQEISDAATVIR